MPAASSALSHRFLRPDLRSARARDQRVACTPR